MPIQHIPRYLMLLEDLTKDTDEKHADFMNLTKALTQMRKVAA